MSNERRRLLKEPALHSVWIHVYDLVEANSYLNFAGLGIYHSSVEVHGYEWAYGGHDVPGHSGIYAMPASSMPREPGARVGTEEQFYVYRASYPARSTRLTKEEVEDIIHRLGSQEYKGTCYHILQRNCNHFTDDFLKELTGEGAPGWINRLANLAVRLHCLVPSGYLPELIEERGRAAAGQIAGGDGGFD